MEIRPEQPSDIAAIRQITKAAFASMEYSSQTEAEIVDALREAGALTVSLVAVQDGAVLGHIAFSPLRSMAKTRAGLDLDRSRSGRTVKKRALAASSFATAYRGLPMSEPEAASFSAILATTGASASRMTPMRRRLRNISCTWRSTATRLRAKSAITTASVPLDREAEVLKTRSPSPSRMLGNWLRDCSSGG